MNKRGDVVTSGRRLSVWVFIVLTLLVSVERRVAELDLDVDDEVAFGDDGGVDGGEILDRLVLFEDIKPPRAPDAVRLAVTLVAPPDVTSPALEQIAPRVPRAPPFDALS